MGGGANINGATYLQRAGAGNPINSTITLNRDIDLALLVVIGAYGGSERADRYHITVTSSTAQEVYGNTQVYEAWDTKAGYRVAFYKNLKSGDRINFRVDSTPGFGSVYVIN